MGITGLLPLLEKNKASRPCNIKEFSGCTVVADAYCWLHRGAFACADKLAKGEQTNMYVQYCMKYVNMLLSHNIKPILVFDGRHLPAKAQTEKKRREKRQESKSQALALLRQGRAAEARTFLQRCVDVTHAMALNVIKECHKMDVDCIVAPHEADAQLAFFNLEGIADLVITEDSDLLLFGCKKVMFKLDLIGNGILVEEEKLKLCMGIRPENYSFDKFRYMCILSGCDYLESLPGIGLTKACQFITRTQDPDIHRALSRMPYQLNMRGLSVNMEYRDGFIKADAMFRHQLVFDPRTRKVRPLTPFPPVDPTSPLAGGPFPGCKPELEDSIAYQLALGNIDPISMEKMHSFDPDAPKPEGPKKKYYGQSPAESKSSIWSEAFYSGERKKSSVKPSFMEVSSRPVESTKGMEKALDVDILKKRKHFADENVSSNLPNDKRQAIEESKMLSIYASPREDSKTLSTFFSPKPAATNPTEEKPSPEKTPSAEPTSPVLTPKRISTNPFARRNCSDNKNLGNKLFSLLHTPSLGISNVQSRYFSNSPKEETVPSPKENTNSLHLKEERVTFTIEKRKSSPSKTEPVACPKEEIESSPSPLTRNPFKKSDQSPVESSLTVSPILEKMNLSKELSLSPTESTNQVTTSNYATPSPSESNGAGKKLQKPFISPLIRKLNEKKSVQSHKEQGSKGSKKGNVESQPQLGAGVKRQGLLSCYGFIPKTKLPKP